MSQIINDTPEAVVGVKILQSLSTEKYFVRSLNAGHKVAIADNNNLVEIDKINGAKIVSKLEHDDSLLSEVENKICAKFSKVIISIK